MSLTSDPPRTLEVQHLEFDTRLFGARCGSVVRSDERRDTDELACELQSLLSAARSDGYAHLIFRAAAEDNASIWAAEAAAMRLVDIGVDSTFTFGTTPLPTAPVAPLVRRALASDIAPLQDIAAGAFTRSRFVVDPFFGPDDNERLHREWVRNLFGGLAQAIFVCDVEGQVAGFVSCAVSHEQGRIPLIATHPDVRRRGVGRALVSAALAWFAEQGVPVTHVKTQSHNYPALALYHRAGYVVSKTELTFSVTLKPQQGDQSHG